MRNNESGIADLQRTIQGVLADPAVSHNHDLHMIILRAQVALEGDDWQWLSGAFWYELRMYPYDHDGEIPESIAGFAAKVRCCCQPQSVCLKVVMTLHGITRN